MVRNVRKERLSTGSVFAAAGLDKLVLLGL